MSALPDQTLQRARGDLRLGFAERGGRTRLSDLYQSGSAKALMPNVHGGPPVAVIINTAGGLTGGDRFSYAAELGPGAEVTIATQTAERAYRASSGTARLDVTLRAGAGARLEWLPQETILFEGSALRRRLELDLESDARALLLEAVVLGRAAMGENPDALSLTDQWRLRRDGRLIHAEALRLDAPLSDARRGSAGLGHARAFATLAYLAPDAEDRLAQVRAILVEQPGLRAAASAWDGRLVLRFLAADGQILRRALSDFLTRFRGTPLPRVWTM